mmetsp:Transcript_25968/g.83873  ORF Transcript_25968/g.83873 Transcript_25968/m.83873 type:complete len:338 (-) Transcript_25968:2859-3872(-)
MGDLPAWTARAVGGDCCCMLRRDEALAEGTASDEPLVHNPVADAFAVETVFARERDELRTLINNLYGAFRHSRLPSLPRRRAHAKSTQTRPTLCPRRVVASAWACNGAVYGRCSRRVIPGRGSFTRGRRVRSHWGSSRHMCRRRLFVVDLFAQLSEADGARVIQARGRLVDCDQLGRKSLQDLGRRGAGKGGGLRLFSDAAAHVLPKALQPDAEERREGDKEEHRGEKEQDEPERGHDVHPCHRVARTVGGPLVAALDAFDYQLRLTPAAILGAQHDGEASLRSDDPQRSRAARVADLGRRGVGEAICKWHASADGLPLGGGIDDQPPRAHLGGRVD